MTPDEARRNIGETVAKGTETGELTAVSGGWAWVRSGEGEESVPCDPADLELIAGKVPGDG